MPTFDERSSSAITESRFWPEFLQSDVDMIGIVPKQLFPNMGDGEVARFYVDSKHFNQNGQIYFTPLVTPALIKAYENHILH